MHLNTEKASQMEKIREFESFQSSRFSLGSQLLESPRKTINTEIFNIGTPTYASQIEMYKSSLEKQKIAKRRAIAEKEQYKEDLAYAILNISELQQKLMKFEIEAKEHDFINFLSCEAALVEKLILENSVD